MRKFLSTTLVVVALFSVTALGEPPSSPSTLCADGHIPIAGYSCTDGETGHGNRQAGDDSTLAYIKTLIADYNPFVFFLK